MFAPGLEAGPGKIQKEAKKGPQIFLQSSYLYFSPTDGIKAVGKMHILALLVS